LTTVTTVLAGTHFWELIFTNGIIQFGTGTPDSALNMTKRAGEINSEPLYDDEDIEDDE